MTLPRRATWLVFAALLYPGICGAAGAPAPDKRPAATAGRKQVVEPAFPCGATPCRRGQFPPAGWRPYSDSSPFNRKIGPAARLIRDAACENVPRGSTCSAEMIKRLLGDIPRRKQPANLIAPQDGIGGWPTYYGTAEDPLYTIACIEFGGGCVVEGMRVHAPSGAVVQGNDPTLRFSDRHLTIVDQTSQRAFDLWHVARVLDWAAQEGRVLLTHDVSTMTAHVAARVRAGLPMPGVLAISQSCPIGKAIEEILLLAECSFEGEWEGQVRYLPL